MKKSSAGSATPTGTELKTTGDHGTAPPEWFTITDLDQLKVISNKLRARILAQFAEREQTAKQVAQRLGESPTKLYRHVDALAEHGLIVQTRQEQKRGTVQKFYRAVARRFRVDDACFAQADVPEGSQVGLVLELLNEMSSELTDLSANFQGEYVSAMSALAKLPKSKLEEAGQEIFDAIDAILQKHKASDRQKRSAEEYRISVVIQPTATASRKAKARTKALKKSTPEQKSTGTKSQSKKR